MSQRKRLTPGRKRSLSSRRWLERQLNDPYVKQAKADGYRSRAAYKLIELDEKYALLKGVERVIDLAHLLQFGLLQPDDAEPTRLMAICRVSAEFCTSAMTGAFGPLIAFIAVPDE